MRFVLILLVILSSTATAVATQPRQLYVAASFDGKVIVYHRYIDDAVLSFALSDQLELLTPTPVLDYDSLPSDLRRYSVSPLDYNEELLWWGLARLRTPTTAPVAYRDAEQSARAQRRGAWAQLLAPSIPAQKPATAMQRSSAPFRERIQDFLAKAWKATLWSLSAGILVLLLTLVYRKLYIQRRPRLLILGQAKSGKTALCERILDPNVDPSKLLDLPQTPKVERRQKRTHISHGRFELYPRLADVPGGAYGAAWDELSRGWFRRAHALVLVLAPTSSNRDRAADTRYMDVQLGYTQAFVAGALGARKTHKPKAVFLFLNKFDLVSEHDATDRTVLNVRKDFEAAFAAHIEAVRLSCKKSGIPIHILTGSAGLGWNVKRLV